MNKKIVLACTQCSSRNYTTTKNPTTHPERLDVRKFCKTCGKHTLHRETKDESRRLECGCTSMIRCLKNVSRETRKVSWPKGRELTSYTITVIVTVACVALYFAIIDIGITQILNVLFE